MKDVTSEEKFLDIDMHKPDNGRLQKVSRDGPCPCGGGKKFKRCCGILKSQLN